MKSSTLRRSTLSKETISVIESLAANEETSGEYLRPDEVVANNVVQSENNENKAKEIDLLWQNFKVAQFNTKSPFAYVTMGFVSGIIVTLLASFITINYVQKKPNKPVVNIEKAKLFDNNVSENVKKKGVKIPSENENVNNNKQVTNSETVVKTGEEYVVKEGDTGVKIIKKHYGKYNPELEEVVKKANNLSSLDRLTIDQKLILPPEE